MLILYPDIKPYADHRLEVGQGHTLYLEESGNPDGIPVLFVHGGPGIGSAPRNRCFFDPEKYRIILFDQRGAGRSAPHAGITANDTPSLLEDMESIRRLLGIERWVLFGGSWGSTLSLLYAEKFPERVMGMILRGIFLCRQRDLQWFYQDGASRIFPDYWEDFVHPIPSAERGDLISAYYRRLTSENELERMAAAKAWSTWEGRCATLRPNQSVVSNFAEPHVAMSLARIEAHYFVNNCFIRENQILEDSAALAGIPGIIVHGRYDLICPLENACILSDLWPDAELDIIRDAGHSAQEPGIVDALVRAGMDMARLLEDQGQTP